jgi:hypothetical protein
LTLYKPDIAIAVFISEGIFFLIARGMGEASGVRHSCPLVTFG